MESGVQNIFWHMEYLSLNFNKLFILNPNLLSLAKKLLSFLIVVWFQEDMSPIQQFLRLRFMEFIII
jgi:hypothetical protein